MYKKIINQLKNNKQTKLLLEHYKITNKIFLDEIMTKDMSDDLVWLFRESTIKNQFEYLEKFLLENLNIRIDNSNYKMSEKIDDWVRECLIK